MSVRLKTFILGVGDSLLAGMGTDAFYTRASARTKSSFREQSLSNMYAATRGRRCILGRHEEDPKDEDHS